MASIRENYDRLDDPELEIGYLGCLETVCSALESENPFTQIRSLATSHCDYIFSLEREIIEVKNDENSNLRKWASPIAHRLADEMPSIENGSLEQAQIRAALEKLLFHNPSFAAAFIGTKIIKESYFDNPP